MSVCQILISETPLMAIKQILSTLTPVFLQANSTEINGIAPVKLQWCKIGVSEGRITPWIFNRA